MLRRTECSIAGVGSGPELRDASALGVLAREEKCLDELAFPAQRHTRKPFVPPAFGHFRFGVEPFRQQFKLRGGNSTPLDAVEQMLEDGRWDVLAADLRHGPL